MNRRAVVPFILHLSSLLKAVQRMAWYERGVAMTKGLLGSLASLLAGAGLVFGQAPEPQPPAQPPPVSAPPSKPAEAPAPSAEVLPPPRPENGGNGLPALFGGNGGPGYNQGVVSFSAEYLIWFFDEPRVPVLASNTLLTVGGGNLLTLGALGTFVDNKDFDYNKNPLSGGRFMLGYWFPGPQPLGVEGNLLFLGKHNFNNFKRDEASNLIRPFFDLNNRQESGLFVANPLTNFGTPLGISGSTGNIAITGSGQLWGTQANVWKNIYTEEPPCRNFRFDIMAGLRYLNVGEDISVSSVTQYLPELTGAFAPFSGNRVTVADIFTTRNQFYGGQFGAALKLFFSDLVLDVSGRIGLGNTNEEIHIQGGQSRVLTNGTSIVTPGGLFAQPTNIGRFHHNDFSVVPELNVNFAYWITDHVNVTLGYNFLFWNKIARPGDQIDRELDVTLIQNFPLGTGSVRTGLVHPARLNRETSFFAQGFNVGLGIVW
jgi:hypothetical protein